MLMVLAPVKFYFIQELNSGVMPLDYIKNDLFRETYNLRNFSEQIHVLLIHVFIENRIFVLQNSELK